VERGACHIAMLYLLRLPPKVEIFTAIFLILTSNLSLKMSPYSSRDVVGHMAVLLAIYGYLLCPYVFMRACEDTSKILRL